MKNMAKIRLSYSDAKPLILKIFVSSKIFEEFAIFEDLSCNTDLLSTKFTLEI